jgi:hypothetical protein
MKILASYQEYKMWVGSNQDEYYIKDLMISAQKSGRGYGVVELENALKTGAMVASYGIFAQGQGHEDLAVLDYLKGLGIGEDIKSLYEYLKDQDYQVGRWGGFDSIKIEYKDDRFEGDIYLNKSEEKGVRVYSPFTLERLKPLKEVPKKWNLKHAIRAIANGQFTDLRCKMYLTDDYAMDAAYDFRKGEIKAPHNFIKKIIENPRGWWSSLGETGCVNLCCHHFDSNGFVLDLNKK